MKRKLLLIIVSIVVIMSIGFSLVACNKVDATNDNSNSNPTPPPAPVPTTYTITYNLDEGENNASNPATYYLGEEITLQDPTKDGYNFDGWYLESTFSTKVTKVSGDGDVVLYAKWVPSISINIDGKFMLKIAESSIYTAYLLPLGTDFSDDVIWSIESGNEYIYLNATSGTEINIMGVVEGNATIKVRSGSLQQTFDIIVTE